MARNSVLSLQVLASDTPPHHQTTHRVMASLKGRYRPWRGSWKRPSAWEGVFKKPWPVWEHSHWEMVCPHQQRNFMGGALWQESKFNCCSSVFNCIAGQVHQEPWQGQASKGPASTGDWWGSLFPFREEWMANWHGYWYNRHWEKLQCPDTQGYITEEEQVTSQAKVPWHTNNITKYCLQGLNILPKWNNRKPAFRTATPSQSEIFLQ